jgi:hypothetical protein
MEILIQDTIDHIQINEIMSTQLFLIKHFQNTHVF